MSALLSIFVAGTVSAGVSDLAFADVTHRSFAVIWASDEPVDNASVRIFADADGIDELTGQVQQVLVSSQVALNNGVVKVSVSGVQADTDFFVQTTTLGVSGSVVTYPPEPQPLLQVTTAIEVRKSDASGNPIVNDLVLHQVHNPADSDFDQGALVLAVIPELSQYPVSSFVGADGIVGAGGLDLNNIFEDADGSSAQTIGNQRIEIVEYRGLRCDPGNQALARVRRVPAQTEIPLLTEALPPAACFSPTGLSADLDCDGRIGLVDFTRFLAKFQLEEGDCRFSPDADLDADGRVGLVDFTQFLSVFGSVE